MLPSNYILVYAYDFDDEQGYFDFCSIYKSISSGCYIIVPDELHSIFHTRNDVTKDYEFVSRGVLDSDTKFKLFK